MNVNWGEISVGVAALIVLMTGIKVAANLVRRMITAVEEQAEAHRNERREWREDATERSEKADKVLERLEQTIRAALVERG
jgi:phage/plasmid primase-like uncharacterized protein